MKPTLIVIVSIIALFVAGFTALLWDYIYYPIVEYKAEKAAIRYLKALYREDFVIDDITYAKPLGDDAGEYRIRAHPAAKPEIEFAMDVAQDLSSVADHYKESKWRYDILMEYVPLIDTLSPGFRSYTVNMYIPDELLEMYPIETKYSEIRKLHGKVTEEYLFAGVVVPDNFNEQRALEYGYRAVEFVKMRNLKDTWIEINFYPRSLIDHLGKNERKKSVFNFRTEYFHDALPYRFDFDSRAGPINTSLEQINSPEDLKPFLVYRPSK